MVVEAIELLVGGRADPAAGADRAPRRPGSRAASCGAAAPTTPPTPDEVVLARVIPATGRSRAYVDGRLATAGELAELGAALVDLHGQHAHQSLLHPAAQREALDRFGGVDLGPLRAARATSTTARRAGRASAATSGPGPASSTCCASRSTSSTPPRIDGPDEDERLEAEEDVLADATAHREAAAAGAWRR